MSVLGKQPRSAITPAMPTFYTPQVGATLASYVAEQLDTRFMSLDVAPGGKINWMSIAAKLNENGIGPAGDDKLYWTPPKCQRIWRQIAYGCDIGDLNHCLPDSDGEDEIEGVDGFELPPDLQVNITANSAAIHAAAAPNVTNEEMTSVLTKYCASVVAKATAGGKTSLKHGPAGDPASSLNAQNNTATAPFMSLSDMAADGMMSALMTGITQAEHAIIDEGVRAIVGPPPLPTRSARTLFSHVYVENAKRICGEKQALLEKQLEDVRKRMESDPRNEALTAELTAVLSAVVDVSSAASVERVIASAWGELTAEQRGEYVELEAQDDRRYIEAWRRYASMYKEIYRLVILHGPESSDSTTTPTNTLERDALMKAALARPLGRIVTPGEAAALGWPSAAGRGVSALPKAGRGRGKGRGAASIQTAQTTLPPPTSTTGAPQTQAQEHPAAGAGRGGRGRGRGAPPLPFGATPTFPSVATISTAPQPTQHSVQPGDTAAMMKASVKVMTPAPMATSLGREASGGNPGSGAGVTPATTAAHKDAPLPSASLADSDISMS